MLYTTKVFSRVPWCPYDSGFSYSPKKLSRSGWGNVVAVKAESLIPDVSVEDDGTNHTKNLKGENENMIFFCFLFF